MEFFKETEFQETQIGRIPKDWVTEKINELFDVETGTTPSTREPKYWDDGTINWITPTDLSKLSNNIFIEESERKITKVAIQECSLTVMAKGSIILSTRAPVGYIAVLAQESSFNQGCKGLIRKNNTKVCSEYYSFFFLHKKHILEDRSGGSTFRELSKKSLEGFRVPILPKSEQEAIANILLQVDSLIQKTDTIILKTQELKKGLMQELLTRGIGHKEFKYSEELGCEIPKEWKIGAVSEICHKPEYGYTQSATDKQIGPKFLRITDIQDGKVEWDNVPFCLCPESFIDRYKLEVGDILFARTGATTGKSYIIGECPEAVFASYLIRIKTKEEIRPEYLYYFFNSKFYWDQVKKKMGGSAQGGMNASLLSEIKVHFPPKEEQKSIVTVLAHVDKKIDEEKQTKTSLEKMKKSLMQILLTGQVRIKVN